MSFEKGLHFAIFDLQERFWEQCIFKYLRAEPEDHYFLLVSKIHYSCISCCFFVLFLSCWEDCVVYECNTSYWFMYAKIINFIGDLSCQLCPDNSFTWPWLQCKFPCELNKDINYYFIMLLLINHFLLFVDWTSFKHSWKQRIHSR